MKIHQNSSESIKIYQDPSESFKWRGGLRPPSQRGRRPSAAAPLGSQFDWFWWILMDFDGFWWILMDLDGFSWILMNPFAPVSWLWANSGPTLGRADPKLAKNWSQVGMQLRKKIRTNKMALEKDKQAYAQQILKIRALSTAMWVTGMWVATISNLTENLTNCLESNETMAQLLNGLWLVFAWKAMRQLVGLCSHSQVKQVLAAS